MKVVKNLIDNLKKQRNNCPKFTHEKFQENIDKELNHENVFPSILEFYETQIELYQKDKDIFQMGSMDK